MREIIGEARRCEKCDQATAFLVQYTGLSFKGDPWTAVLKDPVPHTQADCDWMVTLKAEQWPRSW